MFGIPSLSGYALPIVGGTALALGVFAGVQTMRLNSAKDALKAEQALREADRAKYTAAYEQARANALAAKAATETARAQITEELTDDYQKRLGAFLGAYSTRLRPTATANKGAGGKADLPSLPYDPSVYIGPGADSGISKTDAGICALVTARMIQARNWAARQSSIDRNAQ